MWGRRYDASEPLWLHIWVNNQTILTWHIFLIYYTQFCFYFNMSKKNKKRKKASNKGLAIICFTELVTASHCSERPFFFTCCYSLGSFLGGFLCAKDFVAQWDSCAVLHALLLQVLSTDCPRWCWDWGNV